MKSIQVQILLFKYQFVAISVATVFLSKIHNCNEFHHLYNNAVKVKACNCSVEDCFLLLIRMIPKIANYFIRVCKNNTSTRAALILYFAILNSQLAVYLADTIFIVTKYIDAATCDSCDFIIVIEYFNKKISPHNVYSNVLSFSAHNIVHIIAEYMMTVIQRTLLNRATTNCEVVSFLPAENL